MGDRTSVYLTVRKTDKEKVEAIIDEHSNGYDDVFEGDCPSDSTATIEYSFYEVNYANLDFENILRDRGIPYDKRWEQGGDYNAGNEVFRIDSDGESILKEFDENTEGMVPLDDVIKAFELNCVDRFIEQMKAEVNVISWEEQDKILSV